MKRILKKIWNEIKVWSTAIYLSILITMYFAIFLPKSLEKESDIVRKLKQ